MENNYQYIFGDLSQYEDAPTMDLRDDERKNDILAKDIIWLYEFLCANGLVTAYLQRRSDGTYYAVAGTNFIQPKDADKRIYGLDFTGYLDWNVLSTIYHALVTAYNILHGYSFRADNPILFRYSTFEKHGAWTDDSDARFREASSGLLVDLEVPEITAYDFVERSPIEKYIAVCNIAEAVYRRFLSCPVFSDEYSYDWSYFEPIEIYPSDSEFEYRAFVGGDHQGHQVYILPKEGTILGAVKVDSKDGSQGYDLEYLGCTPEFRVSYLPSWSTPEAFEEYYYFFSSFMACTTWRKETINGEEFFVIRAGSMSMSKRIIELISNNLHLPLPTYQQAGEEAFLSVKITRIFFKRLITPPK